jgi:fructoselysine transporter
VRRYRKDLKRPFHMWLYPLPSLIAAGGWIWILFSSGLVFVLAGLGLMAIGVGSWLVRARASKEWPFASV